ncbi:Bidirectional sugar transporter sweet17 [Thalictrum thalictroides]|uniref:Bidirectional sugar transporter sweet17 n=1 Tax=Thalictrum thalictroides TaxID=46969 RepID=A0A7J6WJ60_THATH|nr:Bidirectional sugar transporter sweet17 [Thalictrum thalictroides]
MACFPECVHGVDYAHLFYKVPGLVHKCFYSPRRPFSCKLATIGELMSLYALVKRLLKIATAVVLVTQLMLEDDLRIDVIGLISAGLNIVMYASPLSAMKTMVTTEHMPFFLSFFIFLNRGDWAFYTVLKWRSSISRKNRMGWEHLFRDGTAAAAVMTR